MSTHISWSTPSEISDNIFKYKVEKDDPIWKQYVEKAALFDERMVDQWNKIVDVLLVYVALFISVLTSFVIDTSSQFQRNPADITNDLLVAIYMQLAAQSDNVSISLIDLKALFHQNETDYEYALSRNVLLYTSLSLCIVVSVMALAAKLWLVSYTHDAFSSGSPYERAMKRQEVYNGILAWRMGAVINTLPVILLIALIMFGFFVHLSISPIQATIGYVVGAILILGLTTLLVTSLAAAFSAACPFRSSFSATIQFVFKFLQKLSSFMCRGLSQRMIRWLWIGSLTLLWIASCALIAYASVVNSAGFLSLVCIPIAITIAYAAHEEITHRPQEYKVPHLVFLMFIIIAPPLAAVPPFTGLKHRLSYPIVFSLYGIGILVLFFTGWMGGRMAVSMVETGEVDAIAWLLTSTSSQDPESFKKAGQIASLGSHGPHYRPRLLKSLMPLLSLLITSHRNASDRIGILEDQQMYHLEIYVSCLAILSDFEDYEGSFWLMREDAKQHPKLDLDPNEQLLRNKLVELARNPLYCSSLRSASAKVLNSYGLDSQGKDKL